MISVEESNRRQYEKDMELHDCGYWSVCEDHACGCAISDNVGGFNNEIYQNGKLDLQEQAEEFYDDDDYYANFCCEDEDNWFNDCVDDYYENYCKPYDE